MREVKIRGDECQPLLHHQAVHVQVVGFGSRGDLQRSCPQMYAPVQEIAPPLAATKRLGRGLSCKLLTGVIWVKFNP